MGPSIPPCISVHFTYLWKGVSGTIRAAVVLAHVPGCITLQGLLLRGTDCNLCLFHTAFVQRSKKKGIWQSVIQKVVPLKNKTEVCHADREISTEQRT